MLKDEHPELAKYWNYKRNEKDGVHFEDLTPHSGKTVWWICDKGHEWQASVDHISNGTRCPYCSNKKVLLGYNDLASTNPKLAREWNYKRNGGLSPKDITSGSNKKVWWKCSKNHEWEANISDRNYNGVGCPYCTNRYVLVGFNDLTTTNPELISEWNYTKNTDIKPTDVTAGSQKRVWWICSKGHEWETTINNRAKKNSGCPFCSGRYAISGQNDLATLNPELAAEWNYERNGDLKPEDIPPGSPRKIWWKCKEGHEWEATINNRNKGRNCPFCGNKKVLPGYNDLATRNPQLASEWNYERNGDLKPQNFMPNSIQKVWWKCPRGHEWEAVIYSRNGGRDCPICSQNLRISFPEKILFFYIKRVFPDAIENYKAAWLGRKELDIYVPSIKTGIEYDGSWYHKDEARDLEKDKLCKEQGVTLIRIREKNAPRIKTNSIVFTLSENRTDGDGKNLMPGLQFLEEQLGVDFDIDLSRDHNEIRSTVAGFYLKNCVAETNPELLEEWDYEKNEQAGNTPENVMAGARVDIWWKCKNGHSYRTTINNRTSGCTGCPYCASKKVLPGYNDLATTRKDLLARWNYEKNKTIDPTRITSGSKKVVWWKCERGHEWEAMVYTVTKGDRCPYCSGHRILPGFNDLATTNKDLLVWWNYEKNRELSPSNVTAGSHKEAWWKCKYGHEWKNKIYNVANRGDRCPYCSGRKKIA